MARKPPNTVDIHVGSRVRLRRMLVGMSQEKLGESLGLTFQQVQKYEKGSNRIGASRLYQIAQVLGVPVQYFFENLPASAQRPGQAAGFAEAEDTTPFVMDFVSTSEGLQLNRAFNAISDPLVRKRVLDLVKSLSEDGESRTASREGKSVEPQQSLDQASDQDES